MIALLQRGEGKGTHLATRILLTEKPSFAERILEDFCSIEFVRADDGLVFFVVVVVIAYFEEDGVCFGVTSHKEFIVDGYFQSIVFKEGDLVRHEGIPEDVGKTFAVRGVGVLDGEIEELVEELVHVNGAP